MDQKVFPLSITQVNWKTFIDVYKDKVGESPVRSLDNSNIDPKSVAGYLAALGFGNPLEQLRSGVYRNQSFQHFHVSFIVICDDEEVISMLNNFRSKILTVKTKLRFQYLCIVTGSMDDWLQDIVTGSHNDLVRPIVNDIYDHFNQGGFREILSNLKKSLQQDGTFKLQWK